MWAKTFTGGALAMIAIVMALAARGDEGMSSPLNACQLKPQAAKTRDAILEAAKAQNAEALVALTDSEGYYLGQRGERNFSYMIAAYKEAGTDIYGILIKLLNSPCEPVDTSAGRYYKWPSFGNRSFSELTEDQLQLVEAVHGDEPRNSFSNEGRYIGWRVSVSHNGTWQSFFTGRVNN